MTDGNASIWKMALWGNSRDARAIQRLLQIFSTRLGKLADTHGWKLALGLQLRKDKGTDKDPNEEIKNKEEKNVLEGLRVLNHLALVKTGGTLTIPTDLLDENTFGCFVRKGRVAGLELMTGSTVISLEPLCSLQ